MAFASGCLFLLSLALLCFHKLCRTRPGLVLTLEMVTAAYPALESIVWSHGQQEMMASVLLVYIAPRSKEEKGHETTTPLGGLAALRTPKLE